MAPEPTSTGVPLPETGAFEHRPNESTAVINLPDATTAPAYPPAQSISNNLRPQPITPVSLPVEPNNFHGPPSESKIVVNLPPKSPLRDRSPARSTIGISAPASPFTTNIPTTPAQVDDIPTPPVLLSHTPTTPEEVHNAAPVDNRPTPTWFILLWLRNPWTLAVLWVVGFSYLSSNYAFVNVAYHYDTVFNDTLRAAKKAAEISLEPAEALFDIHKLRREADLVLNGMQRTVAGFESFWPHAVSNSTVRVRYTALKAVEADFQSRGRESVYAMDGILSAAMLVSVNHVDVAAAAASKTVDMSPDTIAQQFRSKRLRIAALDERNSTAAMRDAIIRDEVCKCQIKLADTARSLSADCKHAHRIMYDISSSFHAILEFMTREILHRKQTTKEDIDRIEQSNRDHARRQTAVWIHPCFGWITGLVRLWESLAGKPPAADAFARPHQKMAELERVEAHLLLTQVHLRTIRSLLSDVLVESSRLMDRSGCDQRGLVASVLRRWIPPPPTQLQQLQPKPANDTLVLWRGILAHLQTQLRSWDAQQFHDDIHTLRASYNTFSPEKQGE